MKKVLAAICASFLMAGPAVAKNATASIPVQAQVVGNCTVTSSGAIDFGTYDGTADKLADTKITVSCTQSHIGATGAVVKIGSGSAVPFTLEGAASTDTLSYQLFTDSARTNGWTDQTIDVTKGSTGTDVMVYAKLASGQDAADDVYSDTLTVTVTY